VDPEALVAVLPSRELPFPAGDNRLLAAATPALMLLGGLRLAVSPAAFPVLMEHVTAAVHRCAARMEETGVPPDTARQALFVLCATADDVAGHLPGISPELAANYSVQQRFVRESGGGLHFFEELDRARQDPERNADLLELFHACLALGFRGPHRAAPGGDAALLKNQSSLAELLERVRPRPAAGLSPQWKGADLPLNTQSVQIPVWAAASFAALLMLAVFLGLRALLAGGTDALLEDMARIFPTSEIAIERKTVEPLRPAAPPPPPIETTQLDHVRAALAGEIAQQKLVVEATPAGIVIRVGSFVSFEPGKATVIDDFRPLAVRIAAALDGEPGAIRVTGHSDTTPIRTVRYASNHELSLERAKAVADLLAKDLKDPTRLVVEGKGDTAPIASNDTTEGRARNRRVDVQLPHAR
jgi:type VI secretion system protein ImpK